MPVPPDLASRRRRVLRRYLAEAGLCPGEVAVAIGVDPEYLQKRVAGSRVITDSMAWKLEHRVGVPLSVLEQRPLFGGPGVQQQGRDLATIAR
jgi:hypothetical protein